MRLMRIMTQEFAGCDSRRMRLGISCTVWSSDYAKTTLATKWTNAHWQLMRSFDHELRAAVQEAAARLTPDA